MSSNEPTTSASNICPVCGDEIEAPASTHPSCAHWLKTGRFLDTDELDVGSLSILSKDIDESGISLINCPACSSEVSNQSPACPKCGQPIKASVPRSFKGPPDECLNCGGALKKGAEKPQEPMGCLLAILGLVLTPVLIGIPVLIYAIVLMGKRVAFWKCQRCGAKFPR